MKTTNEVQALNSFGKEEEIEFEGIYGHYVITQTDRLEVKRYRFAVLFCGVSFFCGLAHWVLLGAEFAWIWLVLLTINLGLALQWIHIYVRPLHNALKVFWAIGCIGLLVLGINQGINNVLPAIAKEPLLTIAIGPLFAAITGLGFKEFFCFRRPEAIGLTLFVPIAVLGHLSQLLNANTVLIMLTTSSLLLLILATRKFGMDASSDIGDKSVFQYLAKQGIVETL